MTTKRELANRYRAGAKILDKYPEFWTKNFEGSTSIKELKNAKNELPKLDELDREWLINSNKFCAIGAYKLALDGVAGYPNDKDRSVTAEKHALGRLVETINDYTCMTAKQAAGALRKVARALDHGAPV